MEKKKEGKEEKKEERETEESGETIDWGDDHRLIDALATSGPSPAAAESSAAQPPV